MGLSILMHGIGTESYEAATNYDNAKEFYTSTESPKDKAHAEAYNGMFYLSTCGKTASSSTRLRFFTLGFDVTLSANGYEVSFAVKRGGAYVGDTYVGDGSMIEHVSAARDDTDGYSYRLYYIPTKTLYDLASKVE